jgi:ATP-dependent DNA ligase
MLAKLERSLRPGFVYEPKWDGFRALAFVDGADVDLRSRNDKQLARYFPELAQALAGRRVVLDGEIVVVGESGALDFASLMSRLHPSKTRVEKLRVETPAVLIAFDVLAEEDEDLRALPFSERRRRLERIVANASPHLALTPATRDLERARGWLEQFHGGGIDGVVAKDPEGPYIAGKRAMIKVKEARTCDCVVAGFRVIGEEPRVSSLLLGLHDANGRLVHVGVVSQLADETRRALLATLAKEVVRLEGHPWEHGFGLEKSPLGRLKGAAGRWIPEEMVRDWIPVRPERVCEVSYDTLDGMRFRYPARLVRFRPDRDARSCGFDQLEEAAPDVRSLFAP